MGMMILHGLLNVTLLIAGVFIGFLLLFAVVGGVVAVFAAMVNMAIDLSRHLYNGLRGIAGGAR